MRRFSEEQFRLYEPLIADAIGVLPSRYTIDVPWRGYAQATVSRNIREALQALRAMQQWETSVNRTKFNAYFPQLEVAEAPGQVIVRLRSRGQCATPEINAQCPNTIELAPHVDPKWIAVLLDAIHAGAMLGLRLRKPTMAIENIQAMVGHRNVAVLQDGEDVVLL